jgi:ankyrin repeat protein
VWRRDPKLTAEVAAENSYQALEESLAKGQDAEVESLLAHGADVNARNTSGETHLHHLSGIRGNGVGLLLAHGADVNAKTKGGWTPLRWAKSGENQDIVELLRQHGGHK